MSVVDAVSPADVRAIVIPGIDTVDAGLDLPYERCSSQWCREMETRTQRYQRLTNRLGPSGRAVKLLPHSLRQEDLEQRLVWNIPLVREKLQLIEE